MSALTIANFAADAVYAWAVPDDDLRATRSLVEGRNHIAAVVPDQAGTERVLLSVEEGTDRFTDGVVYDDRGEAVASFIRSAQVGEDGLITRALTLMSAPVDAHPASEAGSTADARPVLERYLSHLQRDEFAEAAACFGDDILYSHPPYRSGDARPSFRGRDALLYGWVNLRGPSAAIQRLSKVVQRGDVGFIEGVVDGVPNGGTFLASFRQGPDGRPRRYAAWYCAPRVERR